MRRTCGFGGKGGGCGQARHTGRQAATQHETHLCQVQRVGVGRADLAGTLVPASLPFSSSNQYLARADS